MITIDGGTGKIMHNGFNVASAPMVDHWRMSSDTSNGTDATITAWNQVSTSNHQAGRIGSSMSVSSGIFTFPSTGIYNITGSFAYYIGSTDENIAQIFLYVSYDGSNYNYVTSWRCGQHDDGVHNTITQSYILDVDNTSNVKFYFATDSMGGSSQLRGDADIGESNVTITRLGDT